MEWSFQLENICMEWSFQLAFHRRTAWIYLCANLVLRASCLFDIGKAAKLDWSLL